MARQTRPPKTPLGERLVEVREMLGFEGQRASFAATVGLTEPMLGYYERGDRTPDALALGEYRIRYGISLSWLITGNGEMFDDQTKAPAPKSVVDPLLMEKLYKAVERVYRDAGQRPPGHRIANEATELLNLLLEKVTDIRDEVVVDAVIPVLAQQLVERLAQAVVEPGTGKLSA